MNPKIAIEGGVQRILSGNQEIRKSGMEGTWQAGRD
jgi:hypothetical protein